MPHHPLRRFGAALAGALKSLFCPDAPKDAAAISYFSLISLFPSILLLIAVVDSVLGWLALHKWVVRRITELFPGSRGFLAANLDALVDPAPAVVLSCVFVVLWSSTWVFSFVESSLNRAWGVTRRRTFWQSRGRSVALMVIGGSLLILSAALTAVVSRLQLHSTGRVAAFAKDPIIITLWSLPLLLAGFLIAIVVFSSVYKLMPDCRVLWVEAFSGGVVAATVWEIGSYVFVTLLPYFDYEGVYGRTGAIIALLAWVYTSNLIMLFGAHFSTHLHRQHQSVEEKIASQATALSGTAARVRSFPGR